MMNQQLLGATPYGVPQVVSARGHTCNQHSVHTVVDQNARHATLPPSVLVVPHYSPPFQGTTSASAAAALKGTYPSVTAAVSNAGWSATPGQTQAPPRTVGPLSWKPAPGHLTQGTSVSSVGSVSVHTHTHTVLYETTNHNSQLTLCLNAEASASVCMSCLPLRPSLVPPSPLTWRSQPRCSPCRQPSRSPWTQMGVER